MDAFAAGMDFITDGMNELSNYLLGSIASFFAVRPALDHILECFIMLTCISGVWILL